MTREEALAVVAESRERLEGRLQRELGPGARLPSWMLEGADDD